MYNADMQVFEFHFNPKKQSKDDLIFDSFCFEPGNVYEKRMGSLYLTGLLKNVLPQNVKFLDILAKKIKEKFYKAVSGSHEKSLKETLKTANEHLEKIAKSGDVSWLGNLSFVVLSLKDYGLNFTKVGDFKIFLLRKGNIVDIDQKVKFDDIEPYPLKIFGNIVSGKLAENDTILVLNEEMAQTFLEENILSKIAAVSPLSQKKLKDILEAKREQLTKTSGLCLLIALTKQTSSKTKEMMAGKKSFKIFSFKEALNPLLKIFRKIRLPKPNIKVSFKKPQVKINKPKLSLAKLPKIKTPVFNKKIIIVLVLTAFLALGYFIFQKQEEKDIEKYQEQLNQIEEKINQAESYSIVIKTNPKAKESAVNLYQEALNELNPLDNIAASLPVVIKEKVKNLKKTISENIDRLNKTE